LNPMSISGETPETCRQVGPLGGAPAKPARARIDVLWQFGAGLSALVFLRLFPFSSYASFPVCGFHWLTGRQCPLCGMTRALSCLTRGDWAGAIHFNLLSPIVFGMLLATTGSAVLQFFAPELSCRADLGIRQGNAFSACIALLAVYGVLRISHLAP